MIPEEPEGKKPEAGKTDEGNRGPSPAKAKEPFPVCNVCGAKHRKQVHCSFCGELVNFGSYGEHVGGHRRRGKVGR